MKTLSILTGLSFLVLGLTANASLACGAKGAQAAETQNGKLHASCGKKNCKLKHKKTSEKESQTSKSI